MRGWLLPGSLGGALGLAAGFLFASVTSDWTTRPVTGIVVGLVLGILAATAGGLAVQLVVQRAADDMKAKAVRSMLESEIDANLSVLVDLRNQLKEGTSEETTDLRRADIFLPQTRPVWSQGVFSSQVLLLPLALGNDRAKVDQVFRVYDGLARITSIHDALTRMLEMRIMVNQPDGFRNERERLWRQSADIISGLIKTGNPLWEKTSDGGPSE